jgi:hypothetical protein
MIADLTFSMSCCYNIRMYTGHKVLILSLALSAMLPSAMLPSAIIVPVNFALFAQDGGSFTLPPELHRPQYGEAPRFPEDYWIGELGRGDAGEEAYQFARRFVEDLAGGGQAPAHIEAALESLEGLETRNVRIGGGRIEADGSVSFLVRFLGREEALTGEICLRRREQEPGVEVSEISETPEVSETSEVSETPETSERPGVSETSAWYVDDLILDQRRPLGESRYGPGSEDLTPYERFF